MPLEPLTILATDLRMVRRWLHHHGHDEDALFARHNIDLAALDKPRARLPSDVVETLLKDLRDNMSVPCLGTELAHFHRLNDTHALGVTLLAAVNGREALERATRYQRLMTTGAPMSLLESGGDLSLVFEPKAFSTVLDVVEPYFFLMLWRWMGLATPSGWGPRSVHLTIPRPDNHCFEEAMPCPVQWRSKRASMAFDAAQLLEPWTMSNTEVVSANEPILENLLRGLRTGDVTSSVRLAVLESLEDKLMSEAEIADALHMSTRTLQRRLRSENTSFGEVVQETRLQLAQQLLSSPDISATEVGLACGFADASAFSRAFKRWTGQTPGQYQTGQQASA